MSTKGHKLQNPESYAIGWPIPGGPQWDEDVELYYFNARWYDPETGRFITEDPIRDGTGWYNYVGNNPMGFVDPTGLEKSDEKSAAAANKAAYHPSSDYTKTYGEKTQTELQNLEHRLNKLYRLTGKTRLYGNKFNLGFKGRWQVHKSLTSNKNNNSHGGVYYDLQLIDLSKIDNNKNKKASQQESDPAEGDGSAENSSEEGDAEAEGNNNQSSRNNEEKGKFKNPIIVNYSLQVPGILTSRFGDRNDAGIIGEFHHGADIANRLGTQIRSVANGKLLSAGYSVELGWHVVILHPDGVKSVYGHLMPNPGFSEIPRGTNILQGQMIGLMGNSGRSTGPHLHLAFIIPRRLLETRDWGLRDVESDWADLHVNPNQFVILPEVQ